MCAVGLLARVSADSEEFSHSRKLGHRAGQNNGNTWSGDQRGTQFNSNQMFQMFSGTDAKSGLTCVAPPSALHDNRSEGWPAVRRPTGAS